MRGTWQPYRSPVYGVYALANCGEGKNRSVSHGRGVGGKYERTDLACGCLALVCLVPEWKALVREAKLGPAQRSSVQLLEAATLEIVADDGDTSRIGACELAEAGDGEEDVLERVERRVFCRHACELVCGWEETGRAREAQVRLALGRRSERRGVAPGEGRRRINRSINGRVVSLACGECA